MSAMNYDRTQTQAERQQARQKQIDMMEAAASGQNTPTKTHSSHSAPPDAIDNARRFLWDEDDDDYNKGSSGYNNNPSAGGGHDNTHKMLMGSGAGTHGGGIGGRIATMVGSLPRFTARTGLEGGQPPVNLAPRNQRGAFHNDARSRSSDELEYTDHHRSSGFVSTIGDCCMSVIHTIVGLFALLVECIVGCFAEINPKLLALLCGGCFGMSLFVFAIVAIVHRTAGGRGTAASSAATQIEDEVRFHSIRNSILESAFTSADHLDAKGTAQNLALRWLTDFDPANLETDDDALFQRYALAVFYFSTYLNANLHDKISGVPEEGGWLKMDNWMSDKGICLWYGVTCPPHLHEGAEVSQYNENSDVLKLNLTDNNVAGTIPSEIRALENLKALDLGKNMITGTLPKAILSLNYLDELYLQENELTGTIPPEIGGLVAIRDLFLGTNKLKGKIPPDLGKLTAMRALGLDENFLTGTIPVDLWKCSNLLILYLDSNRLEGTISSDLKNLKQVIDLRLRKNILSGSIPKEIQELVHLELLYLDDNELTGTIPDVFGLMPRIQELQLYKNKLAGSLPASISLLPDLKVFYGDSNALVGTLPTAYGLLNDLHTFYVFNNKMTGIIPTEYGNMSNLVDFQIYGNKFTGPIPKQLGLNYKLAKFEAQENALTGTIPTELGMLESLKMLKVHNNEIVGTMPSAVCALKNNFDLDFVSADCTTKKGTIECSCCDACYP